MMDRLEMMTSNSEQIVNRAVDAEKALELCTPSNSAATAPAV